MIRKKIDKISTKKQTKKNENYRLKIDDLF